MTTQCIVLTRKPKKIESRLQLHNDIVNAIAHHPHQNISASCANDKLLKIWNA